jgi:hypothetical protein
MSLTKQESRTDNASRKTSSTTRHERREQANKARKLAAGTSACKDGAELLRQAADKRVGLNSEKLADLLAENALQGDLTSAKVLIGLAERKKPSKEPVKKRRGPSLAERWAAEPEWREEPEEGPAETGCGGAEAEE